MCIHEEHFFKNLAIATHPAHYSEKFHFYNQHERRGSTFRILTIQYLYLSLIVKLIRISWLEVYRIYYKLTFSCSKEVSSEESIFKH